MVAQTIKLPVLIRRTDRCQNKNYFTGETFCVESIKTERRLGYGKMECPQCHSSCGKTDKFCSECGFKLAVPVKDPVNQGDSSQSIQPEQPLVGDSEGNHKEGNEGIEDVSEDIDVELFEDAQDSLTMSEDDVTSKVEGSLEENMGASKDPEPPEDLTIERITAHSVSLSWRRPAGLEDTLTYVVSYHSSRDEKKFTCTSSSAQISNLKPATEYNFSVKGCDENGVERMAVSKNAWTRLSIPKKVAIEAVDEFSAWLQWNKPHGMDRIQHLFQISWHRPAEEAKVTTSTSCRAMLSELDPGTEYSVSVSTLLENGMQSSDVSITFFTKPSPPKKLDIISLDATSFVLGWGRPSGMDGVPYKFCVTWSSSGRPNYSITTSENLAVVPDLRPGIDYMVSVCTILEDSGQKSVPVNITVRTNLPPPGEITVHMVTLNSASLSWGAPEGMGGKLERFRVTWDCQGVKKSCKVKNDRSVNIQRLHPGREYVFSVATIGDNSLQSKCVSVSVFTEPSPPVRLKAEEVRSRSVRLCWERPDGMEGLSYTFNICYSCEGEQPRTMESSTTAAVLSDLKPGVEHTITVTTMLPNGSRSSGSTLHVYTKTSLNELAFDLGLEKNLVKKLTLSNMLEISSDTITDRPIKSTEALPWCFLKKLMMVNVTARSNMVTVEDDEHFQTIESLLYSVHNQQDCVNAVNPLDVVTALFLCSDSFLQQEMVLKMSMCQFSVPLLLPNCDTQQCTLMLWALRDIVKKFRPHSLIEQKGFVEDSIVLTQLPMISFVRLGFCSLSKSLILNQVFSNPQQYHDTFVHHNMASGDTARRISDGLVEMSWYLPCGNQNIDIFPEPVAVANLRGDIGSCETQFSFLCQTSAAVFVFCDDLRGSCELLELLHIKARLFLVNNLQHKNFDSDNFKHQVSKLKVPPSNVILKKPQMNEADFIKKLRSAISMFLRENSFKMSVKGMATIAHELGIPVDEDCANCKSAEKIADTITASISDIPTYKEKELPLQGDVWKKVAKLEKEECRLKKAGDKSIEIYKSELSKEKQNLREQQGAHDISEAMLSFISAISNSREERSYFLKWMRINLDNISRKNLSNLREEYQNNCVNSPENKELITDLDKQISSSSLGVEHFLREMGQLYESACTLPADRPARQQMKNLPRLCAELLQDGFPLELVDGDASNIPLKWVSAVLMELHKLTGSKSKIRVVTVLGVQSTGKSTLLNTMFGVQFAVSSGRCTRGAFMLLIRVKEDFKKQLGCDYIMIIDTEGLKSPELAQLDDSYEHDNELSTLVVGLSDITVINIAMENSTDMKDILQIVVHAFLRMKEVGKKPCCQFVHQNVPDVAAHNKNVRDRKLLLEQLNEMTQAAARMENRGFNKTFTDIMEYKPEENNWYIPGLWHGNPPMAPVSAGYSEAVNDFKKSIINAFKECKKPAHTFSEFLKWTESLWNAVKYENFIFSFRNSLVADAYSKLCVEFNMWDWAFRKHMYSWLTEAETKVSNFGTMVQSQPIDAEELLSNLKSEATVQLAGQEKIVLDNISEYYKRQEGHVHLVEKYKEDFVNTAKSLRREMENSLKNKIEAAVEIRKGMLRLERIRKKHTDTMEEKVFKLIEKFRKIQTEMSDEQLEVEFGKMWDETVKELSFTGLKRRNIVQDVYNQLRTNVEREGSSVHEMMSKCLGNLSEYGLEPFKVKNKDGWNFKKFFGKFFGDEQKQKTQEMADCIINDSHHFVAEKVGTQADYHDTYTIDLLRLIDESLEKHRYLEISADFEASLKMHVCGHAAREFQGMHDYFNNMNDPRRCLDQFRDQYCADFKDLFHQRDQCEKKASEFACLCLAPAVKNYVTKCLGPDIVDEMLTGNRAIDFTTRSFFQFSILKKLLLDGVFKNYVKYNTSYEEFVKHWIFEQMVKHFSRGENTLPTMEIKHLKVIIKKIKEAILSAQKEKENGNIYEFVQDICTSLGKELVIPKDTLDAVMALNNAIPKEFSQFLILAIEGMEQTLITEFKGQRDVGEKLSLLSLKPQDVLFKRVFGCGKQCPFCKVPCEAGGQNHMEHFASIHRPQGIGMYRDLRSTELVTDICSSSVASEYKFQCWETEGKFHPYKDYRDIFPDWCIQPDTSIQASDYWKYVFVKFNKQFAKEFYAKPADLPSTWKSITRAHAMKSLEESFKMKKQAE